MSIHWVGLYFTCQECGKVYGGYANLVDIYGSKVYVCGNCFATYQHRNRIEWHKEGF